MKNRFSLTILILVTAALTTAAFSPAQSAGPLITVMNPAVANKMADRVPLSPRLESLEGKTLYLVDIGWGGPQAAPSVYEEIQAWFAQNKPGVKTVIRRIKGSYESDDPELWKEIKQNGDAALIGIAG